MTTPLEILVNGKRHRVAATPDTPLLYVLRNELDLHGPRFGCGLAQCGACTVHVDGAPVRSCVMPVIAVRGKRVTTLDGLAASYRSAKRIADPLQLHPVQQAFIDEQAMQCGYCTNGWIMTAAAMLDSKPEVSDEEIRRGLSGLKCRCGAHMSVMRAVKRASKTMA
ncbi:MAG: (2Fe-2S)-binding protein [Pseudomonadota bacterium]|nr:(2Fe-2S)-binding protein [Pseudomonadota bacterium]